MASHSLFIIFTFLLFTSSFGRTIFSDSKIEPVIFQRAEKTTRLHFFFHDKLSSPNPTAVKVIDKGMRFGTTFVIDDPLTVGPDRDSKIIGRAQGSYMMAAQNDVSLMMVVTYTFTEGRHNGSSISVVGRNHVFDDVREMPVVGGSGAFRLGRGYALAHTVWYDAKSGDAIVEYNVTVLHY